MTVRNLVATALAKPESMLGLSPNEWNFLVRQARSALLLGRLAALLEQRGWLERVPAGPRGHLMAAATMTRRQHQAVRWEVRCLHRALGALATPVILLKGAAYVLAELPAAQGRVFSDVDILLPKEQLNQAEAALMLHGWASTHLSAYDQRYYRKWMHELPPMQHIKRMAVVDVHHAILPETARLKPNSAKLRAASVALAGHPQLRVFAPCDMVLHSATHLFHDGELEHGLRDLTDLDSLLRYFGAQPSFWETLPRRAVELDLARPLYYALRYTQHFLGTPLPQTVLNAAAAGGPSWPLRVLMDALFARALRPAHPSANDLFTLPARWLLYLRSHWLRMPLHLLAPHLLRKALVKNEGGE